MYLKPFRSALNLQNGEVGYRAGVGGTQQSGYLVVHPRAHARSAPHGADSGEARV